jgi:hypothetical protein
MKKVFIAALCLLFTVLCACSRISKNDPFYPIIKNFDGTAEYAVYESNGTRALLFWGGAL